MLFFLTCGKTLLRKEVCAVRTCAFQPFKQKDFVLEPREECVRELEEKVKCAEEKPIPREEANQNPQTHDNIVPIFRRLKKQRGVLFLKPEYAPTTTDTWKGFRTKGHPGAG